MKKPGTALSPTQCCTECGRIIIYDFRLKPICKCGKPPSFPKVKTQEEIIAEIETMEKEIRNSQQILINTHGIGYFWMLAGKYSAVAKASLYDAPLVENFPGDGQEEKVSIVDQFLDEGDADAVFAHRFTGIPYGFR